MPTPENVAAIAEQVRHRVLRWFARSGLLDGAPDFRFPARYLWAMLLARLIESIPLTCPNCGAGPILCG